MGHASRSPLVRPILLRPLHGGVLMAIPGVYGSACPVVLERSGHRDLSAPSRVLVGGWSRRGAPAPNRPPTWERELIPSPQNLLLVWGMLLLGPNRGADPVDVGLSPKGAFTSLRRANAPGA